MENPIDGYNAQDMILDFALKNKPHWIDSDFIRKGLFPNQSEELIELLMTKIINTVDPIVEYQKTDYSFVIRATSLTDTFLLQGGFTALRKKQEEEQRIIEEEKKYNMVSIKSAISMNKWNKIGILFSIIISLASLVIAIFALMKN